MLTSREWHKLQMPLCRTHAVQGSLYYLLLTLVFGWWGAISFLVNWVAIAVDLFAFCIGIFQRRPQGDSGAGLSFRQWDKSRTFLGHLGAYTEGVEPPTGGSDPLG
jgi:hypothetical protein